jgi:hypothetical protein
MDDPTGQNIFHMIEALEDRKVSLTRANLLGSSRPLTFHLTIDKLLTFNDIINNSEKDQNAHLRLTTS